MAYRSIFVRGDAAPAATRPASWCSTCVCDFSTNRQKEHDEDVVDNDALAALRARGASVMFGSRIKRQVSVARRLRREMSRERFLPAEEVRVG